LGLIAVVGNFIAGKVIEVTAVAVVVPDGAASPEEEAACDVSISVDTYTGNWVEDEGGEGEVLAGVSCVDGVTRQVYGCGAGILDDDVLVSLAPRLLTVVIDRGDDYLGTTGRWGWRGCARGRH
jgi:hypothetical protein